MKAIVNFIVSIFLIEVGFFLFFGTDMNLNEGSKNLTNYQSNNMPPVGTEVELYVIDVGELFLKNDNITSLRYDSECYYIAQINDGRFVIIKTEEGSDTDVKINEYYEKYYNYYIHKRGEKPEILYLDGIIDKVPELDSGNFSDEIRSAKRSMMSVRGYVRMDVNEIIVDVDRKAGRSMDSVLSQSIDVMISAANALKKFLGVVVIFMGVIMIISFIREILSGVTYPGSGQVLIAGDDVFKNISVMKNNEDDDLIISDMHKEDVKETGNNTSDKKTSKGFKLKN